MTETAKARIVALYRPKDARLCLACDHAMPHIRGEYEDTHSRCEETWKSRHIGSGCGHKRYNAACENSEREDGCYSLEQNCECSEEDRVIAELDSRLSRAHDALRQIANGRRDLLRNCEHAHCHECGQMKDAAQIATAALGALKEGE